MSNFEIKGFYRDRLTDVNQQLIFDSGWKSNLIVLQCRELLAGFMMNDSVLGIQSLQVGRGDASWDTPPPPAPDPNTTIELVDPAPHIIQSSDLTLQYITASDGISDHPTHRIEIIAVLGVGEPTPDTEPPYPLREFGLFGDLNGTPYMIDYIRHPLIEKNGAATLERRVRFTF